ncbi:hypothetical protein CAP39_11815 [Sphingomonas sp. IBVSS1]|uniref:Tetratricopeptide repeat protein n=2 Tax=Sandarakinorhabdus cyanobacteriorum TaxID=1981098 RepID=A0A255YDF0_9SPHN|nr:hypothetical protein CAP39_11815 [Sphingomonas sp. IBVSS1]OYQ27221.1 hypothetical protein CHU93_10815 [Sandarakinorhabdus cyanobacteriorum]
MAGTTLGAASPALAQKKPEAAKPAPPKLSKPVMAVVMAVQKLQQAGDHAGALAKLTEAAAVPRAEKDDALILAKLKLFSAQTIKDNAKLEEGLTEAVEAPSITPDEKLMFSKFVAGLASNRKDYGKAWTWYEFYLGQKPDDVEITVQAASVAAALKQPARVYELLTKAIDLREAKNETGDRSWYEFRAQTAIDNKMDDKLLPSLLGWVKAFPEPKSYNLAIGLVKQRQGNLDNNVLVDFGRLMSAAGAMTDANNYLEYADAALDRGMPNEAEIVLKEGIAKQLLDGSKQNIKEFVAQAASKNAESKAGLAALEKDAKTSPRLALVVADTFANLKQYDKAITWYKTLVGNAMIDQDTVNLRLAFALKNSGDAAGAKAALANVKAGPRAIIAKFMDVVIGDAA